jgi:hypothetical protein
MNRFTTGNGFALAAGVAMSLVFLNRTARIEQPTPLAPGALPAALDTASAPRPRAQLSGANQAMFGFRAGEERRYVLGPPEALVEGERFEWSITLADVFMSEGRLYARFELGYDVRRYSGLTGLDPANLSGRSLRAQLVVNEAGFPGVLTVQERMNDAVITTAYALQDEQTYAMTVEWPGERYVFEIPVATHAELDLAAPQGLYLFDNGRSLGGTPRTTALDSLFANPGLLSLALPWPPPEDGWEGEFLALAPAARIPRYPSGDLLRQLRNSHAARLRNFSRQRLRLGTRSELAMGGRTVPALPLEVRGPYRRGFVDPLGRVLLLEHQLRRHNTEVHIRMLWPSEVESR